MLHRYSELNSIRPEIHPDHLDEHSGWLTARYEIVIKRDPEDIWEYIYDPAAWTASNPDEHMGLQFYDQENRPKTGAAFHQKESVAGVPADLYGYILFVQRPNICVWNGVARYRLFGFVPFYVPEAGVVRQESANGGTLLSHTVYLRIPNTILGKLLYRFSSRSARQRGYIPHTFKELLYFKQRLEKESEETSG